MAAFTWTVLFMEAEPQSLLLTLSPKFQSQKLARAGNNHSRGWDGRFLYEMNPVSSILVNGLVFASWLVKIDEHIIKLDAKD